EALLEGIVGAEARPLTSGFAVDVFGSHHGRRRTLPAGGLDAEQVVAVAAVLLTDHGLAPASLQRGLSHQETWLNPKSRCSFFGHGQHGGDKFCGRVETGLAWRAGCRCVDPIDDQWLVLWRGKGRGWLPIGIDQRLRLARLRTIRATVHDLGWSRSGYCKLARQSQSSLVEQPGVISSRLCDGGVRIARPFGACGLCHLSERVGLFCRSFPLAQLAHQYIGQPDSAP